MIYLHENGVTVVATDQEKRGKVYELNGEKYYVARGVSDIKRIVDSGEYPLNRVITSKLTSLNYLFQIRGGWNNDAVPDNFSDDISNWDTSNVLSMDEVFSGWPKFNGDISNWDTSRVESMYGMFKSSKYVGSHYMGDTSFNQDISNWDTSRVKNMSEMFLGATSFNQDISNWDVGSVGNMDYMFSGATSFNQNINNWDVSNVKSMYYMFSNITKIGIVAFVGTYEFNWADSTAFNQPVGNWNVSNVVNMRGMFSGATSFNQDISNWDVSNVETMLHMFSSGRKGEWDNEWQTKKHCAFLRQNAENNPTSFNQDISNWDVSNVYSMGGMFSGATSFNQSIGNWDTIRVKNMSEMFSGATSFNQDISNWDTSRVKNMSEMYLGATSFNQDISGWDVSSLSWVEGMFYGATSFNTPIEKWKLKSITSMENMFREATAFNQDISSWDVSNVTEMKGLFQDATSFNQNIRNWKLNKELPKSRTMFKGATAFNIKEYNPFLNKIAKERKVDTSTANLSTEDKRTFSKIKKLIVSRDTDQIDLGVELAVSLNNSSIFSSLLVECKLNQTESGYNDGEIQTQLVTNKLFTGGGPAQPFLNYALISMIANIPENDEIEIDDSIKIKNIKALNLTAISFKADWNSSKKCKTPDLTNFIYLKKLTASGSIPTKYKSSTLTELILKDFAGSLEFLSEFTNLEYLNIEISSYSDIESIESFKNLVSLRELILSPGGKFTDINFLSECKKLQKLDLAIESRYSRSGDTKINDITVLSNLKNLEELNIRGIHSDLDISPIGGCKNLKDLNLQGDMSDLSSIGGCKNLKNLNLAFSDQNVMPDISVLSSCNELSDLTISGCAPYDFNSKIENINGIKLAENLISIKIADNWNNGVTITGEDGGSLSNANPKIKPKSLDKGYIPKLDAEELTDEDHVTQSRVSEDAEKKTISKKNLKSEDKKTFTKIKSLLQARDFDKIDMGIELLRSINIVEFYEALLADCKINTVKELEKETSWSRDKSQNIIYNKFFKGSGPAQPYLNYALYLLIYYCPDEAEIDDSLRKKNINILDTNIFFQHNYDVKYRLPPIENFTSLYELKINPRSYNLDYSKPEDVLKNSSVLKMRINDPVKSLMWLKNFPQLNDLFMSKDGYGEATKDINVFEYLTNLEELKMSCPNSENIDFLKNCVNIKKLNIDLNGRYSEGSKVQNIDALKYLTKLEELDISVPKDVKIEGGESFSYEGLSNCKKLKNLIISSDDATNLLANLKSCSALEKLDLKSKDQFNIKLSTSNFYGINKFDKLKSLNLDGTRIKF